MSAFSVVPRPKAVVSFYGYGDITGPWYSQPSPHYRMQPLVSEYEAFSCVGKTPLSEPGNPERRQRFYLYLRQQGLWPRHVAGIDPAKHPEAFKPWSPILNVSADWPPVLLLHGTADTDVPYERSVDMAKALSSMQAANRLVTIADGEHGFDRGVTLDEMKRQNGSAPVRAAVDAVEFAVRHLRL